MKARKKINKSFDSLASKRKAQSRIYHKIKGMNPAQEMDYFERATRNGPFSTLWKKLVAKGRKATGSGKLARPSA